MFPLGFRLEQICPNDKFIEIFALRFHSFEDPFYKFFALNLLFHDTSYSLALKYSSFCLSFSVLHFMILISGSKSVKLAQKFCIFLKFLTLEGTLLDTVYFFRSASLLTLKFEHCVRKQSFIAIIYRQ